MSPGLLVELVLLGLLAVTRRIVGEVIRGQLRIGLGGGRGNRSLALVPGRPSLCIVGAQVLMIRPQVLMISAHVTGVGADGTAILGNIVPVGSDIACVLTDVLSVGTHGTA